VNASATWQVRCMRRLSKDGANAMVHWRADGKEVFFRGLNLADSHSGELEVRPPAILLKQIGVGVWSRNLSKIGPV
jgi:hypothetical protein